MKSFPRRVLWIMAICQCLPAISEAASPIRYRLRRVESGYLSDEYYMNNRGQFTFADVTPYSPTFMHSKIFDGEKIVDIGRGPDNGYLQVKGINNQGVVLAGSVLASNIRSSFAYLYKDGIFTKITAIPIFDDPYYFFPRGLNDHNDIVGDIAFNAFSVIDGQFEFLPGYVDAPTKAVAINHSRTIAGEVSTEWFKPPHAATWKNGKFTDLGTLTDAPRAGSSTLGMNNAGTVVGWATLEPGAGEGFIASAGKMIGISKWNPALDIERIYCVNDFHVSGSEYAIVIGGKQYSLNDITERDEVKYPFLSYASSINVKGQIGALASVSTGTEFVILDPIPSTNPGHLINISVRARTGTGEETAIAGFVVSQPGGNFLLRGAGPSLKEYGLPEAVLNPRSTLYNSTSQSIAANDDWQASTPPLDHQTFKKAGAFDFADASKDSAMLQTLPAGAYTLHANAVSANGVVLTEIYDASPDAHTTAHLTNLSSRIHVGTGANIGIAGFVIGGEGRCRLMIRAIGPSLSQFGISKPLPNPLLWLYNDEGNPVLGNDDWGKAGDFPLLDRCMDALKIFTLPDGSKDSVMLIELEPGNYTAQVSDPSGAEGTALLEIYALPDIPGL